MTRLLIPGGARSVRIRAWGLFAGMALTWLLACGTAFAQTVADTSAASEPSGTAQNSLKLTTVLMALPAGMPWLSLRMGLLCTAGQTVRTATGGRDPQDLPPYAAAFKTELERAGYKVVASDENLFDPEVGAADYQVAAVLSIAYCWLLVTADF